MCIGVYPPKTEAPLIIDANTPLASPIAAQLIEPIGGRHSQIVQCSGGIEHTKFSQGDVLEFSTPPPNPFTGEQPGGVFIAEAADHVV